MFQRGQVVRIARIDPADNKEWEGFIAEVSEDTSAISVYANRNTTKLQPFHDRPDNNGTEWFYWPTDDLELVSENVETWKSTNA